MIQSKGLVLRPSPPSTTSKHSTNKPSSQSKLFESSVKGDIQQHSRVYSNYDTSATYCKRSRFGYDRKSSLPLEADRQRNTFGQTSFETDCLVTVPRGDESQIFKTESSHSAYLGLNSGSCELNSASSQKQLFGTRKAQNNCRNAARDTSNSSMRLSQISPSLSSRHYSGSGSFSFLSPIAVKREIIDVSKMCVVKEEDKSSLRSMNCQYLTNHTNSLVFATKQGPHGCHTNFHSTLETTPGLSSEDESFDEPRLKEELDTDFLPDMPFVFQGLCNLGNTCFMNAALQCLIHAPSVAKYFIRGTYRNHILHNSPIKGELAKSFAEVCSDICQQSSTNTSCVKPTEFKLLIGAWAEQFTGHNQHDAHELMRFLIDGLAEDLNNRERHRLCKPPVLSEDELSSMSLIKQADYWWERHWFTNSSFITEEFCGQLMSTIECSKCGHESLCFDPFYDLSLPIPTKDTQPNTLRNGCGHSLRRSARNAFKSNGLLKDECTLKECLDTFTNDEFLDESNMMFCKKCNGHQCCTKRLKIQRLPKTLVVHLKRFGNAQQKMDTRIHFTIRGLDLEPYSKRHANGYSGSNVKPVYDLFAVCHHHGTLDGGHYTASCLDFSSNEWHQFNDSKVTKINSSDLTPCSSPYMLFYRLRLHT